MTTENHICKARDGHPPGPRKVRLHDQVHEVTYPCVQDGYCPWRAARSGEDDERRRWSEDSGLPTVDVTRL